MAGERGLAQQIRTGLETKTDSAPSLRIIPGVKGKRDPLEDLFFRKPVRHHVKEFGALFALITLLVTGYLLYYKDISVQSTTALFIITAAFLYFGYFQPRILYPVWKGWMAFAEKIGFVMTLVIMSITWVIVLIPTAIALNVIRKRVMNCAFREDVATYWDERDPKLNDFKLLERQF